MAKTLMFDDLIDEHKQNARQQFNARYGFRGNEAPPGDPEGVFLGVNIDRPATLNARIFDGVPSASPDEIRNDEAIALRQYAQSNGGRPKRFESMALGHPVADTGKTLYFDDVQKNSKPSKYKLGGDFGNFFEGAKKGLVDIGLGVKQRMLEFGKNQQDSVFYDDYGNELVNAPKTSGQSGADTRLDDVNQSIQQRRAYYDPLMKTKAGMAGNVTGSVVGSLPAVFIPGAATIRGAAAIGAAQGYLSPTVEGESAGKNAAVGGLLGAAIPGAVGAYRGAKGLLTNDYAAKGAAKILGQYGIENKHLYDLTSAPTVTGARMMLPEQLRDPQAIAGAARLRDNLGTLPGQAPRLSGHDMLNNEARVNTLYDLAGDSGARAVAEKARALEAKVGYGEAYKTPFNIEKFPQKLKSDYVNLMAKLDESGAIRIAEKEAALRGNNFNLASDIESLHLTKEALDSLLAKAEAQSAPMVGLTKTKKELVAFMKNVSKKYETARSDFAASSIPINQMDVAAKVLEKGTKPGFISELSDRRIMPGELTRTLDNEAKLISSAAPKSSERTLSGLLNPDQYTRLKAVGDEVGLEADARRLGAGFGSPTAQRGEGLKFLTGAGLLGSASPKVGLAMAATRYVKGKVLEPKIHSLLTDIMLNPGSANRVMASLAPKERGLLQDALDSEISGGLLRQSLPALYQSERQN